MEKDFSGNPAAVLTDCVRLQQDSDLIALLNVKVTQPGHITAFFRRDSNQAFLFQMAEDIINMGICESLSYLKVDLE